MLRKRTRSVQKDVGETIIPQAGLASNVELQTRDSNQKSNSFFDVASSLFWVLSPKNGSYNDSAKSPKSPLDAVFLRFPGSSQQIPGQKSWNSSKVGLGLVDSLEANDGKNVFARDRIVLSSDNKGVGFGPKKGTEPQSSGADLSSSEAADKPLPRNLSSPRACVKSSVHKGSSGVVFEIGGAPFDSESDLDPQLIKGSRELSHLSFSTVTSKDGFVGSLSTTEIELSEDYTCVTLHGPNPKTTHIYGDCVLECHPSNESLTDFVKKSEEDKQAIPKVPVPGSYPFANFLSTCYTCNKSLEEGKDIYIYRGEKAFCSAECRWEEISFDKETRETTDGTSTI